MVLNVIATLPMFVSIAIMIDLSIAKGPEDDGNLLKMFPKDPWPNSKRPFHEQQYWDPVNRIYREKGSLGSNDPTELVWGEAFHERHESPQGQNPLRTTIIVCGNCPS